MAASRVGLLSARLRAAGPGMLWSVHQPSLTAGCSRPCIRNFSNYHRILQMITFGIVTRVRPLHLLVATGGGYVGYYQYHKYKRRELEHCGLDELVKESLAPAWQFSLHLGG